jgi:hypothetical protein
MPVQSTSTYGDSSPGVGVVGGTGDAAWYGRTRRNNVGLTLNEWLQKHQKHNNNSIIKQDILHNIYHFNIVSHVFEVDESICCSQFSPKWLQQLMTIVLYPRPYLRYKNTPGLDHIRGVQNTSFYGSSTTVLLIPSTIRVILNLVQLCLISLTKVWRAQTGSDGNTEILLKLICRNYLINVCITCVS